MKTELQLRLKTAKNGTIELIDEKYNPVAKMVFYPDGLDHKAARQIAAAVNAHEELLAALKQLSRSVPMDAANFNMGGAVKQGLRMAEQAIAKAEGRS